MRRTDQRRAAVVALYQADVTDAAPRTCSTAAPRRSRASWWRAWSATATELDALIERHAEGWTLDRIAPLERNILRVALHELLHRPDVPAEVAIDEAVEAAKELCSADAPGLRERHPRRRSRARGGPA